MVPFVPWWFKFLGLIATPIVQKNVLTPRAEPEPLPGPKKGGSRNFTTPDGGRRPRVSMRVETTSEIFVPQAPQDGTSRVGQVRHGRRPTVLLRGSKHGVPVRRKAGRVAGALRIAEAPDWYAGTSATRRNANALEERTSPTTESQTGASAERSAPATPEGRHSRPRRRGRSPPMPAVVPGNPRAWGGRSIRWQELPPYCRKGQSAPEPEATETGGREGVVQRTGGTADFESEEKEVRYYFL